MYGFSANNERQILNKQISSSEYQMYWLADSHSFSIVQERHKNQFACHYQCVFTCKDQSSKTRSSLVSRRV
jgi:hypothetical protein